MPIKKHYRTVVVSDLHLGLPHAKVNEMILFLRSLTCERLILNGDILDGWYIRKHPQCGWRSDCLRLYRAVSEMIEQCATEVIYTCGNHDDFWRAHVPTHFGPVRIVEDYVLSSGDRQYFVTHGDCFDAVTRRATWLSRLGASCYELLLQLNQVYNRYRAYRRKAPYSFARALKKWVKDTVSSFTDFEKKLTDFASGHQYGGIICGHIHYPENRFIGDIHYLNSGDWVESQSALVEDEQAHWQVVYFRG